MESPGGEAETGALARSIAKSGMDECGTIPSFVSQESMASAILWSSSCFGGVLCSGRKLVC